MLECVCVRKEEGVDFFVRDLAGWVVSGEMDRRG